MRVVLCLGLPSATRLIFLLSVSSEDREKKRVKALPANGNDNGAVKSDRNGNGVKANGVKAANGVVAKSKTA